MTSQNGYSPAKGWAQSTGAAKQVLNQVPEALAMGRPFCIAFLKKLCYTG